MAPAAFDRGTAAYTAFRADPRFAAYDARPAKVARPKFGKLYSAPRPHDAHVVAYFLNRARVQRLPGSIALVRQHLEATARLMVREPDAEVRARQKEIVRDRAARIEAMQAEYDAMFGQVAK